MCSTPVCTDCGDFSLCFGDESGESRMAERRREASLQDPALSTPPQRRHPRVTGMDADDDNAVDREFARSSLLSDAEMPEVAARTLSLGRTASITTAAICLRRAGLRPTRQRLMLGEFLFSKGGRHVTADMLYTEAVEANMPISRATVYNTLNQFTDAGLLRQIGIDGSKSFFDTNPTAHHHFFVDQRRQPVRRSRAWRRDRQLPQPLPGYEIAGVDVIVHLRRKQC